jgi:hypothetical protein
MSIRALVSILLLGLVLACLYSDAKGIVPAPNNEAVYIANSACVINVHDGMSIVELNAQYIVGCSIPHTDRLVELKGEE